jgi:adenylate cyclase
MAIEIERKFLVRGDAWRSQVKATRRLAQGYLGAVGGKASVRVRVGGGEARFNIKASVVGSSRAEYDYEMPMQDAEEILASLCVGRVEKVRHLIDHGDHVWEVDEFSGDNAGLIVAEIELSDRDEDFDRPDWLGEEVTDDARYYNHALAQKPFRDW